MNTLNPIYERSRRIPQQARGSTVVGHDQSVEDFLGRRAFPLVRQLPSSIRRSSYVDYVAFEAHVDSVGKRERVHRHGLLSNDSRRRYLLGGSTEQCERRDPVLTLETTCSRRQSIKHAQTLVPVVPGELVVDWPRAHPAAQTLTPVEERDAAQLTDVSEHRQQSGRGDPRDTSSNHCSRHFLFQPESSFLPYSVAR